MPEEDGDEESFSEALSETAEEESELPSTTVPQEAANSVHDIPRASKNNKILRFFIFVLLYFYFLKTSNRLPFSSQL